MNGPFVRDGQGGNASLTSAVNNPFEQLYRAPERVLCVNAACAALTQTSFVIRNLQVL